ncbi:hypothetical protein FSP39_006949 [Pinctada imbricata]|uniref:Major facilitator superfamily domain-containing protein 2 n=1 Tax=Pinctada imbricata TaxID=66713 RepID=A0AA88Y5C7_PINIB|nr:hypothetical protein FSP39_006949 [Pinctada imbricata]
MEPTFDLSGYEPPISLWQIVEQHVPKHEHEEIKNMLGQSLVDQSLELHNEIETLLDIWRDYRDETNENCKTKLPEPPGLRERLVQELQFFIQNVKEKSKNMGMNAEDVLHSRHNMDILEYAMEGKRPGTSRGNSRPGTARSRDGRETPMISTPTSSDRASAASTLSEEIESMNDKMNFLKFDEVVQHLKETLEDEIETLLSDIHFLYECLDDEATYRAETQELQTERSKMEQELLSTDLVPQPKIPPQRAARPIGNTVPLKKLGGQLPNSLKIKVNGLTGVDSKNDSGHSVRLTNDKQATRPGPMRASHAISLGHNNSSTNSPSDISQNNLVGVVRVGKRPDTMSGIIKGSESATSDYDSITTPHPPSGPRPQEEVRLIVVEDFHSHDDTLPLWRKLCFAAGGPPYQITNTVINFFLSIFLLEVAEISPSYVSIIVFGGKVWDAITDPTCGYLVNKTNTRLGKLRPWILISTPFACTAYFFLWYVPDLSEEGKLGWYFCFYCLFQGLLSGIHVPFTSLTMFISNNQKDRDSATAYRMVFEAVGVLLAAVVQGQFVNKYRTAGDCKKDTTSSTEQINDQKWSYMEGSFVVIGIYVICAVTCFLGTKEKQGVVTDTSGGFFTGIREVLTFGPYVKLCTAFLFLSLAIAIVQGNLALFCTHTLKLGDDFSLFIIVLLVSAIASMSLWQFLLRKYGKKSSFAAGMVLFIPILISQLFLDGNFYIYMLVVIVAGFSISVALLLPWSMLPDVLDDYMLKTGHRRDAIFYSFYVFFNKIAVGFGVGLSQLALAFGGYKSGECKQPASVGLALRLLVAPGPVIFVLIALLFLSKYPIDEETRKKNKEEIERRKIKIEDKQREGNENRDTTTILPPDEFVATLSYESIAVTTSTEF